MSFEQKYLKYKEKYLELKKQSGGVRVLSPGPMIGYPAMSVPIMGPSYSVRGPVVGPSPFGPMLAPMPGPFIAGPRLVRVSSEPEHKCTTCPTCATCPTCPAAVAVNIIVMTISGGNFAAGAAAGAAAGGPLAGLASPLRNFPNFTKELLNTTDNLYHGRCLRRLGSLPAPIVIGINEIQLVPSIIINYYDILLGIVRGIAPVAPAPAWFTIANIQAYLGVIINNILPITIAGLDPLIITEITNVLTAVNANITTAATPAATLPILEAISIPVLIKFNMTPLNNLLALDIGVPPPPAAGPALLSEVFKLPKADHNIAFPTAVGAPPFDVAVGAAVAAVGPIAILRPFLGPPPNAAIAGFINITRTAPATPFNVPFTYV
jgi:hypothetical protein